VLALAPFVLVAIGARLLVPALGDSMARKMAELASAAPRDVPTESAAVAVEVLPAGQEAADGGGPPAEAAASVLPRSGAGGRAGRPNIDVPADRLARLTERQLRGIGAATVLGQDGKPAGARLSGVGALGVGLADGDVVTSIGGRATSTADEATAAALDAWSAGPHAETATIVRGGEALAVTVHVPAVDAGSTGAPRGDM
jgi:hypothetical protein